MKRRIALMVFLPVALLMVAISSTAQDSSSSRQYALGIGTSLDHAYDHQGPDQYMGFGHSPGIDLVIPFKNPKWSLTCGLHYTVRLSTYYFDRSRYDEQWLLEHMPDASERWRKTYSYVADLPFQLTFQAGGRHFKFISGAGMGIGVQIASRYWEKFISVNRNYMTEEESWKPVRAHIQCSPMVSAGVQCYPIPTCFIRLQLTYRTFFNLQETFDDTGKFSDYLHRNRHAGVSIGIFKIL